MVFRYDTIIKRSKKSFYILATLALLLMSVGLSNGEPTQAISEQEPSRPVACQTTQFGNEAKPQEVEVCVEVVSCSVVTVSSTKGLSNVIWQTSDGYEDKHEGFADDTYSWDIPQPGGDTYIQAVWIHSGDNHDDGDIQPDNYSGNSVGRYIEVSPPEGCEVLGQTCQAGPGWAAYVDDSDQGLTNGGVAVQANRSDASQALYAADTVDGVIGTFYSLGFGGSLTVGFDGWVTDVDGMDISIHEATFGNRLNYGEETATVEVSQNGTDWYTVGVASGQSTDGVSWFDFHDTGLQWIQYVRLTDTSGSGDFNSSADGFDVDAVDASYIACPIMVRECSVGTPVFMIGDEESSKLDNPADELSWAGAFGDFSNPTDNPFVVGSSPDNHFPWNSNFNQDVATDFDVQFAYAGPAVPKATLTLSWSPGRSASETKEVYLDGSFIGTVTHDGTSVSGWFSNMQVFQDTFELPLTPGLHTLQFVHTSGDGTLWDFVKLELSSCPSESYIQGRKYLDINANGNFDKPEKKNVNRLNDWTINLYDDQWNLVDSMETGDDSTPAGNVAKGQYRFEHLQLGTYYVCEVGQDGWVQSEPFAGAVDPNTGLYCHTVKVTNYHQSVTGIQFGNHPPQVNVIAYKVICDSESLLPNWGRGHSDITADTANDWVAQHEGCYLADGWSFEWKTTKDRTNPGNDTYGPAGGDWQTFTANGPTAVAIVPVQNVSLLQTREVLQSGYIPFAGGSNSNSAEFYCGNDVLHYDNWEWLKNPKDGTTYYCVGFNAPQPVTLHASKIICDAEEFLPNWGDGGPDITASTATNWVENNAEHCRLSDWDFQWAAGASNPGDNSGEASEPWHTFGSSATITPDMMNDSSTLWVREIPDKDYIPFTGANKVLDISAEFYCNQDVLNYDNYDFIRNPQPGADYYCVGWNILVEDILGSIRGLVYGDINDNAIQDPEDYGLDDWTVNLYTHNSPYALYGSTTTAGDGSFEFTGLPLGTYYVCQDVEPNFAQTQVLSVDGFVDSGLSSDTCYEVVLDTPGQIALARDFGNYPPRLGETDVKVDGGSVLGESTLAETGNPILSSVLLGTLLIVLPLILVATTNHSVESGSIKKQ